MMRSAELDGAVPALILEPNRFYESYALFRATAFTRIKLLFVYRRCGEIVENIRYKAADRKSYSEMKIINHIAASGGWGGTKLRRIYLRIKESDT